MPTARAAALKLWPNTCGLTAWVPSRRGNSQRGCRWVRQRRRNSSSRGAGNGTRRCLSPLPMMRRSRLALSRAPTSRVAASLIRRPQAYMRVRLVLWIGFLISLRSLRTGASGRATGRRRCFGGRILFPPEQRPIAFEGPAIQELDAAVVGLECAERHAALAQFKQVRTYLRLAQLVGRAPIVLGQTVDPVEVEALGSGRQPGHPHLFHHLYA